MNNRTRQEAATLLSEMFSLAPDVRMGQMLEWVGFLGMDRCGRPLSEIEDEEFLDVLYEHRRELLGLVASRTAPAEISQLNSENLSQITSPPIVGSTDHAS